MGHNIPPIQKVPPPTSVPSPRKSVGSKDDGSQKRNSMIDQLFDPFGVGLVVGSAVDSLFAFNKDRGEQ